MEMYEVPTVTGTFNVSKAGVDALMPFFEEEFDKWMAGQEVKGGGQRAPVYEFFKDEAEGFDIGQMMATVLLMPYMTFGKSANSDPMSVSAFVKQYANDWFAAKSKDEDEVYNAFHAVYGIVEMTRKATGAFEFEKMSTTGHSWDMLIPMVVDTPIVLEFYKSLEIVFEAEVVKGIKPSEEPIKYDSVPWGKKVDDEFKARQSEEVNANYISQATAASAAAYVIDPYLAEAYLAWKAL